MASKHQDRKASERRTSEKAEPEPDFCIRHEVVPSQGCREQMNMIMHHYVDIQLTFGGARLFVQHGQLLRSVNAMWRIRHAVVAELDDTLRDAWEVESDLPGNDPRIGRNAYARCELGPNPRQVFGTFACQ